MSSKTPRGLPHASERFKAPSTIVAGSPLKNLIGRRMVQLLAESLSTIFPSFPTSKFQEDALRGLGSKGLMERGDHLAQAMRKHLPDDFESAAEILITSMGPELARTDGNGLAPFFYLPHAYFIARFGIEHFEAGMRANYELTKRFTAEFSMRPFLTRHPDQTLGLLRQWIADPNPHVRRAASECTRPRLPWAPRLTAFQQDPSPVLALLERLKDDPSLYVRRSVANNLGDIAKDHPARVFQACQRWLDELSECDTKTVSARRWLIRHAVRLPARKGIAEAVRIRTMARS